MSLSLPLRHFPAPGDYVIAADRGYDSLMAYGVTPDLVVGDFDSLGYTPNHPNVTQLPAEKDDTDMVYALRKGLELGYRRFEIYGSLDGERLDHTIANFQTLQFLADRGATGYLIGADYLVTVVKNGTLRFPAGATGIVSLFCLGADARGVTLEGLHYPLEDGTLTAGFPLGVSNHFIGTDATVSVRDGSLLVLWDRKNGFPQRN
jgi:thiamine pyrophosphokinase